MKNSAILWVSCSAALFLGAGCGKGGQPAGQGKQTGAVLAKVGRAVITRSDLDEALHDLPEYQQNQYGGAFGQRRLLDEMVKGKLVVQAAEDQGLDKDPEVRRQLENVRARLLMQAFSRKMVESQPQPTEADLHAYYDKHAPEFVVTARVNASWIKCATKKEAEAARRRIVESGESFGDVAAKVSIDKETVRDRGLLGYFNPTGYVRGIGAEHPEFNAKAFALDVNKVGPIFEWDGGWAFVKVHEKTPERQQPYEMVRDQIVARLRPSFSDAMLDAELARLRGKYATKVFLDPGKDLEDKSADVLMRLATESQTPSDKVEYYRALLRKYPQYERADEAQFMIGFVYSEEMQDFETARAEYEKVVQNYPKSDIRQSAEYMIQNMGHGLPGFEPESGEATGIPKAGGAGTPRTTPAPGSQKQPGAGGS